MESTEYSIHGQLAVLPPFWRKTVDATGRRVVNRKNKQFRDELRMLPKSVQLRVAQMLERLVCDPVPEDARFFGGASGYFYIPLGGYSLVYGVNINPSTGILQIDPMGTVMGDNPQLQ